LDQGRAIALKFGAPLHARPRNGGEK
jgi:hypothetical protein